jgi:lipoprotein LprG
MPFHLFNGRSARWGFLLLLAGLLAACGDAPVPAATDTIAKAATAMRGVQSMHFALDTNKLDKYPSGLFLLSADGDVAKPDKLHAHAKALLAGFAVQVQVATVGSQQFMSDPASGLWQTMPASFNVLAAFDPNKGISDILANAQNPAADGTESIDGVNCYRLKATLTPDSLRALSTDVNATAPLQSRLWIGADDSFLRQVELDGPLMTDEPSTIVRTIKFTKFNQQFDFPQPTPGTAAK